MCGLGGSKLFCFVSGNVMVGHLRFSFFFLFFPEIFKLRKVSF